MKKFLISLLLLVLLSSLTCFAETPTFDHQQLATLEGYSYDKFEKTWSYYGAYSKQYADAIVVIGLKAYGDSTSVSEILLYAWIRDENNREVILEVEELQILADETLITCTLIPMDSSSATLITDSSFEVLNYIANAKELALKLKFTSGSITLTPTEKEISDFVKAAQIMYEYDWLSYINDTSGWSTVKLLYPITIE